MDDNPPWSSDDIILDGGIGVAPAFNAVIGLDSDGIILDEGMGKGMVIDTYIVDLDETVPDDG